MTEESQKDLKTQLALAIAQGDSISSWARINGVPRRTACHWAKDPAVRETVESCHRRMIEEASRRLAKHSTWAADGIVTLAMQAESNSVKTAALRTILADTTGRLRPRLQMTRERRRFF
jgi:hypothetical protein